MANDTFCCAKSCSLQIMFKIKSLIEAFLNEYTMSR